MNILLVGCGKMGGALLRRWNDLSLYDDICVVEPENISVAEVTKVRSAADIPAGFRPDIIVFAVKPQILADVLDGYRKYTDKGAIALSIAAGKPVSLFEEKFGPKAKVVRAIPNTPAAIGQGTTALFANKNLKATDRKSVTPLFEAVGEVFWVKDEELMHLVTALASSGPAYIFLLIEVMAKAGVSIGLEKDMAEKLARQTVIGSAALAEADRSVPAAQLRENVTSPNGTTRAALDVLMAADGGMQELFDRALAAAVRRSVELSK